MTDRHDRHDEHNGHNGRSKNSGSRNKKNNVNYAAVVLLAVVIVFLSTASAEPGTWSMLCISAAAAFFACLLFLTNYLMIFIVCAASFASALYFGKGILATILVLSYIPTGVVIFMGIIKKRARTQITVRVAVFSVLFYAALIILYFVLSQGSFSLNMLSSAVDKQLTGVLNLMEDYSNQMFSTISPAGYGEYELMTEPAKQEFMMNMKMLIPCVFMLYCISIAYLSTSVFRIFYNIFCAKSKSREIRGTDWRITLSPISAVVMLISATVPILFYDRDNLLPWIVSTNLECILVPGFCIMGIYFIYDKIYALYNSANYFRKSGTIPALSLSFALIFLYMFLKTIVVALLTVLGLYAAVIGNIKKFYGKAKKLLTGDDSDDNDDDNDDNDDNFDDGWD